MPRAATPSGERRRSEILDAALRCFDRLGVTRTMIEDIRIESGASIGSIYHQFASKDDILAHLYSQALSAYRAGIIESLRDHDAPEEGIRAAVDFHVRWIDSHRALSRVMLHWDESELSEAGREMLGEETRRFSLELDRWLKDAAAAGAIRSMPHAISAALFLGPLLEFGRRLVLNATRRPLDEGGEALATGIWHALRT